jgi:hypothetical protein
MSQEASYESENTKDNKLVIIMKQDEDEDASHFSWIIFNTTSIL